MKFKNALIESVGLIKTIFSRGFFVFIFGMLLPVFIGVTICAALIAWALENMIILVPIFFIIGAWWFFFWLMFTESWIT